MTALSPGHWGWVFMGVLLEPFNNRGATTTPVYRCPKARSRQRLTHELLYQPCIGQIAGVRYVVECADIGQCGGVLGKVLECMRVVVGVVRHDRILPSQR